MALGTHDHDSTLTFNASVNATKREVTDNPESLIYTITLLNATAAEAYFQVFDADADDVTVGTTVSKFVIGVEAGSELPVEFPKPVRLKNGFTVASTTTRDGSTNAVMEATITYMSRA